MAGDGRPPQGCAERGGGGGECASRCERSCPIYATAATPTAAAAATTASPAAATINDGYHQ